MPRPWPLPDHLEPFDAAAAHRPASTPDHVGDDWYDALLVPDRACVADIGHVVGHDLQSAAAMDRTRNMPSALLYDRCISPSAVPAHLDRALQAITDNPRFVHREVAEQTARPARSAAVNVGLPTWRCGTSS